MTAAIFSLVGVVVGIGLNAALSWLGERRNERREARATSRMLGRELSAAVVAIRKWKETSEVDSPTRADALRFPAWELYHATAARTLAAGEWDAVSDAYLRTYVLRTGSAFEGTLDEEGTAELVATEEAIVSAIVALRRTADAAIRDPRRARSPEGRRR